MAKRSEAVAKAWRAIALAIEAVDELTADDVDAESESIRREVDAADKRREDELRKAAKDMSPDDETEGDE